MPRATKKAAKPKAAKTKDGEVPQDVAAPGAADDARTATATMELEPPTAPVDEPREEPKPGHGKKDNKSAKEGKAEAPETNGAPSLPVNIAKLQAMSMGDLNHMAKELGIENFGTMRKHEVIFHILQKNAERSGILFSEGVLEVLSEGFGFLRSQSFNYL